MRNSSREGSGSPGGAPNHQNGPIASVSGWKSTTTTQPLGFVDKAMFTLNRCVREPRKVALIWTWRITDLASSTRS